MVGWLGRMDVRERAALFAWTSALIVVVVLPLSYGRAAAGCFYSPEDFARCDPWRSIAALGDGAATLLMAAALWITRNTPTTRLHRVARLLAVSGVAVAIAGSLGAVVGDAYLMARPVAAVGFAALGVALSVESDRGSPLVRSRLGVVVGITLALWAIAYVPRDDWILPTGGAFFVVPFVVWAIRLGYRLGTGRAPSQNEPRPVQTKLVGNAAAVILSFLAFPFWVTSTFGVASIGDPANLVTVKNETGQPIDFYEFRSVKNFRERIEAGETRTWDWLEHGAYSPAAEDLAGTEIFCAYFLDRELRRAHYQIIVTRDPSTCAPR
jgi:hypothetical protein